MFRLSRRAVLGTGAGAVAVAACHTLPWIRTLAGAETTAIAIGSRLELFVDDYLIDRLENASLKLHKPVAQDVAIECTAPWEGNTSAYFALLQDTDRIRLYYRGSHVNDLTQEKLHPEFACYAESRDGLRFEKPKLGLFEFQGSKDNNIIWTAPGSHNFTPFLDTNPSCSPDARYKAMGSGSHEVDGKRKPCLFAFKSPDGIRWSLLQSEPVITDGAFDSQNLAYWDPLRKLYVDFHRKGNQGVRDIMTAVSTDFVKWSRPEFLDYGDAPQEHLYTNAIQPYARAPHLMIGFPTRFQPKTQQVEPILMTSRDGKKFRRWGDALIPITAPKDRDGNRSNYMAWGVLQIPGDSKSISVYAKEAYYKGPGSRLRRFTFGLDRFVSASSEGSGMLHTKLLTFTGNRLLINGQTARSGRIRIELQDSSGKSLPGFSLEDFQPFSGDSIEHDAQWAAGRDLSKLAGTPIRIRFEIIDGDLYSLAFRG